MSAQRATIGKFLRAAGFIAAAAISVWAAWKVGLANRDESREYQLFQVAGPSMSPTLAGPSLHAQCQDCEQSSLVSQHATEALQRHRICSLCGGQLQIKAAVEGQLIRVEPITAIETSWKVGDVVAAQWDKKLRVKRIAGGPGDVISIDGDSLLVNDVRIEDMIGQSDWQATIPVDIDAKRNRSRWSALNASSSWSRSESRSWSWSDSASSSRENSSWESDWLVYQHANVYDDNKPGPVQDDYQFNVGITRHLHTVDRLAVSFDVASGDEVKVRVVFWTRGGNVGTTQVVGASQTTTLSVFDCERAEVDLPVTAEQPIAILIDSTVTLARLTVSRFIEYRLKKLDRRDIYPIKIGPEKYFLLGDNVPVSIDSRDVGPIPLKNITGGVQW